MSHQRRTRWRSWPRGTCRWCKGPVKPPRRTFCSDACVHEYLLRSNPRYLRQKVWERDRGICALCGVDTTQLEPPGRLQHTWEVDHIVPVAEGGGECGLDNVRTLCIPCHRKVTAELRRRLRQRKQA